MDDISRNIPISDQDILDISVKIEEQGRKFYTQLAQMAPAPDVKDFLNHMAAEEAMHEILFKKMIEQKDGEPYGWENQPELKKLVQKMFLTDIFPSLDNLKESLDRIPNLDEAFELAIEAEMVSIEFYRLLADYCENFEAKTALTMLEKVETEHLHYVTALKDKHAQ